MRSPARARSGAAAREDVLAVVGVLAWLAAAVSSRYLGPWITVGGVAILVAVVVPVVAPATVRAGLRPDAQNLLLGALVGAAMAFVTTLAYGPLARLLPFVGDDAGLLYVALRAPHPALVVVGLVPVVLGEELLWRGLAQGALTRRAGTWGGVVGAAILYGLAIAPLGSLLLVLASFAWGACWGALRATSGSLVPPVVAHLVWNALVLLALPLDRL